MTDRLSIQRAYKPVPVDLWPDDGGAVFETVDLVRSLQRKAEALIDKVDSAADTDAEVQLIAEFLDLKLRPTNGKRLKPSSVIMKKWKADGLSAPDLLAFFEAVVEADRPT